MKVFRKVFAAAIALTAIAMASSAFAADGTATYNATAKTMTVVDAATAPFASYNQATIAVVPYNFGGTDANEIYYINQGTGAEVATIATNIGLKGALNAPASYEVRVGGEGDYLTYTVPAVQFNNDSATITDDAVAGRAGVKASFAVNSEIQKLIIKLIDKKNGNITGSYEWQDLNIANVNGATFTFGLEIVGDRDLSGIEVTGVEVE